MSDSLQVVKVDSVALLDSLANVSNSEQVYILLPNRSGESISNDTIFTVLVTIGIFLFGYLLNRWNDNRKEKNRLVQLYHYYSNLIELLKDPIEKQIQSLIEFAKQLKNKEDLHYFVTSYTAFSLNLIDEISNHDLYKIFVNNKNGTLKQKTAIYKQLNSNTTYLIASENYIKKEFNLFTEKLELYDEKFKNHLQKTSEHYDKIITNNAQNGVDPENDVFFVRLIELRNNWIENNENFRDIYVAREHFIEPLLNFCRQNIEDSRVELLLQDALNCVYAMNNLNDTKWVYRRTFLLTARKMRTALRDVLLSLGDFKNLDK
jgi:hypothetical protein